MRLRFSGCLRHVRDPRSRRMEFPCEGVHEVVLTFLIDYECMVRGRWTVLGISEHRPCPCVKALC